MEENQEEIVLVVLSKATLYVMLGYLSWREATKDPIEAVWMLADCSEVLGLEELGLNDGLEGFVPEVGLPCCRVT